MRDGSPEWLVETKVSDIEISSLKHFYGYFSKKLKPVLLIKDLKRELFLDGVHVKRAGDWLQNLDA